MNLGRKKVLFLIQRLVAAQMAKIFWEAQALKQSSGVSDAPENGMKMSRKGRYNQEDELGLKIDRNMAISLMVKEWLKSG